MARTRTSDKESPEPMDEVAASTPPSARELRRRHRDALRAKATGKVQSIAKPANRRIVFDDDHGDEKDEKDVAIEPLEEANDAPTADQGTKDATDPQTTAPAQDSDDDDDDDDDAVEEVKTSTARERETQKRLQERDSARTVQKKVKKRKRKAEAKQNDGGDDDFDEDFFRQLQAEKELAKQERKRAKKLARQPKGRHTTFVVTEKDEITTLPTDAQGVQVSVLSDDNIHTMVAEPTEDSYIYSRSRLESGSDGLSAKQIQKAKKQRKKPVETPSWQRSTKMNRLLAPGRSRSRSGMPALHFAKKKKKVI